MLDLNQLRYAWLNGDEWFDQVVLRVDMEEFLRVSTAVRYKTSPLSGSEWRTSAYWEMMKGGKWETIFETNGRLSTAIATFYGEFYSSFPDMFEMPCTDVWLLRKGVMLLNLAYQPGTSIPLIHCLGHLPYIFQTSFERQEGVYGWQKMTGTHWWTRCFQPGCSEEATVTFRMRHSYCNHAGAHPNSDNSHRRYCRRHAIRGDSDMEDCDQNNITVDGDRRGAGPQPQDVSPAKFGGVIEV